MNPLVSIVIPTYNRANIISQAINSSLMQTYKPLEIIVIDDGSNDNTEEVVKSYSDVRYYRQENQGASQARNAGVSQANGEYIAFLDSDDFWVKQKLELQMNLILALGMNILGSRKKYITNLQGIDLEQKNFDLGYHYIGFEKQLKRTWFSPATIIIKKAYFESLGGFDPNLKIAEDWDLWLKIARQNPIPRMNEILAYCLVLKGGLADNRLEKYLFDLKVIKKWDPINGANISPNLYRRWSINFFLTRLLKLVYRTDRKEAEIFYGEAKHQLPLSNFVLGIGEFLLK